MARITDYALGWNLHTHRGGVSLRIEGSDTPISIRLKAAEVAALALILRQSPAYHDSSSGVVRTGWESVDDSHQEALAAILADDAST